MALKELNSAAGYSVGENTIVTVVDANANVTANNLFVTTSANLGNVSNLKITGGSANYVLTTDGTGNLSWSVGSGVAGSNRDIQFNNNGIFGGSSNLQFDNSSNTFTVKGIVSLPLQTPTRYGDSGSGKYVAFKGPATIAANLTWTLPNVEGNANAVLSNDGTGNLSWREIPTGNLLVGTRDSGTIIVELYNGTLSIVGRSGNIVVPLTA